MILQRLQPGGTLATGVEALLGGAADSLLSRCRRARQKRISRRTGGYSHARQRWPKLLCRQAAGELVLRLREMLNPAGGRMNYVLDGSSLELEASPSLRKAYPPAENQHGHAHWPDCASWCCMSWKRGTGGGAALGTEVRSRGSE